MLSVYSLSSLKLPILIGLHIALLLLQCRIVVHGDPVSKPYVPFRTSPYPDDQATHHPIELKSLLEDEITSNKNRRLYKYDHRSMLKRGSSGDFGNDKCPLQFSIGVSRRSHNNHYGGTQQYESTDSNKNINDGKAATTIRTPLSISQTPKIYPVHPSRGPGKQVIYTTQYEHLDMLSPASPSQIGTFFTKSKSSSTLSDDKNKDKSTTTTSIRDTIIKEGLVQHDDFPLLFESSSFAHTSPIIHDVNSDGIPDAIVADYDGGIYMIGLAYNGESASSSMPIKKRRYFHHTQVPRIYVRKDWMISRINETLPTEPPVAKEEVEDENKKNDEDPHDYYQKDIYDPYHSYFEYSSEYEVASKDVQKGISASIIDQSGDVIKGIEKRRKQRVNHTKPVTDNAEVENVEREKDQQQETGEQQQEQQQQQQQQDGEQQQQQDQQQQEQQQDQQQGGQQEQQQDQQQQEQQQQEQQEGQQEQQQDQQQQEQQQEEQQQQQQQQDQRHRRLQEEGGENENENEENAHHDEEQQQGENEGEDASVHEGNPQNEEEQQQGENGEGHHDGEEMANMYHDDYFEGGDGEPEDKSGAEESGDGSGMDDDEYNPRGRYGYDDYYGHGYDDYYGGNNEAHETYYSSSNFIRIPPHLLCDPVLVEMPKQWGASNDFETEAVLFVAVSYYFDEDEYEGFFSYKRFDPKDTGDESEVHRGTYVTNALMLYTIDSDGKGRWGRQIQLDLSTDYTSILMQDTDVNPSDTGNKTDFFAKVPLQTDESKMGAFALNTPTVVDIDNDNSLDVLVGTSMGMVYVFESRNLWSRDGWPIQMKHPIESRIIVEDVVGDLNLEIFVADVAGNILCLDHKGNTIWNRNLLEGIVPKSSIHGSSPMTLGDVNGDGALDLIVIYKCSMPESKQDNYYIFALLASSGHDISINSRETSFPLVIETPKSGSASNGDVHQKIPQPLLIDLHSDQSYWRSYIQRNGTAWNNMDSETTDGPPPHGGNARGLHIVQPIGSDLYIIEGGSGCIQVIDIGDEITTMVQADDVHGTNSLDLVVSTASGNIVTLESSAVPYHPLNVWNGGEHHRIAGTNSFTHGYSSSQGIFVHHISRQYRDIFGIYVPVTFEIYDNRPNIQNEGSDKRSYLVEIVHGSANQRVVFRKQLNEPGVYTERLYIPYGPGYYTLTVILKTKNGFVYKDTFHIGYNLHFLDGFGLLLWFPLAVVAISILLCTRKKPSWDDETADIDRDGRDGERGLGILGRSLPT